VIAVILLLSAFVGDHCLLLMKGGVIKLIDSAITHLSEPQVAQAVEIYKKLLFKDEGSSFTSISTHVSFF
jgi:hypothetical protein